MKKLMFLALAFAGVLTSCSNDDSIGSGVDNNNDLVPIKIGIGQTAVTTRGTGTVGDTAVALNVWNGQKINVFMFDKYTLSLTPDVFSGKYLFDNAELVVPASVTSLTTAEERDTINSTSTNTYNLVKYYPAQNEYDFWGYRLDGAATGDYINNGDSVVLPFHITGSEDVLVARALPVNSDWTTFAARKNEPTAADSARSFSAFTARYGVDPVLKFQHLLSRLTFGVLAGDENATDVVIDSVLVVSKAVGELVVAYPDPTETKLGRIVWDPTAELDTLSLKERLVESGVENYEAELVPLGYDADNDKALGKNPVWNTVENRADTVKVGEALLVAPSETGYRLIVKMHQNVSTTTAPEAPNPYRFSVETNLSRTGGFEASHSYRVLLTLYGLTKITVKVDLENWIDEPEAIEITPEDESI